jgi:predicted metal-dependent hydrolase
LREALDQAALLFDAGLHFEVHELLEPFWLRTEGAEKEALQGLIQMAVGFHHLATHNVSGARMLLEEGSARLFGKRLEGLDLNAFALAVRRSLESISQLGPDASRKFDWSFAPEFPRMH